ncbi:hypothetical protein GR198_20520 [Rhizobium leguminosarum]|uniref:hypothetical protein n=1 Tax=Rhizobium leguminosarum TaxID=384 RepID=UPI0013C16ADB|nr:hypothetical protein [Rhizobium leguminosarum]NEH58113.1 hypothetical protein [Rhizobium leguminosarum]
MDVFDWPDEIKHVVKTSNGVIVVSDATVVEFDHAGNRTEIASLKEIEKAALGKEDVGDLPGFDDAGFLKNETLLITNNGRVYAVRISDRKTAYLGKAMLDDIFLLHEGNSKNIAVLSFSTEGNAHLFDVENMKIVDLPENVVRPTDFFVLGDRVFFQYTNDLGGGVGVYDRLNGQITVISAPRVAEPVVGLIDDQNIVYAPSSGARSVNVISLKNKSVTVSDGSYGTMATTDDPRLWYLGFADAIFRWDQTTSQIKPIEGLPTKGIQLFRSTQNGRILVASDSGVFLANIKEGKAKRLSDAPGISVVQEAGNGTWILGSDASIFIFDANDETISTLPHDAGRVVSVVMSSPNVGFAIGELGLVRFSVREKTLATFLTKSQIPLEVDDLKLADDNVFSTKIGNLSYVIVGNKGVFHNILVPKGQTLQHMGRIYNGNYHISASNGLYILDPKTLTMEHIRETGLSVLSDINVFSTSDHEYIIYNHGLIRRVVLSRPLEDPILANRGNIERLPPQDVPVQVRWRFKHPCVRGLSSFDLLLKVFNDKGDEPFEAPLRLEKFGDDKGTWISATANAKFDTPGTWRVELVGEVEGGEELLASEEVRISFSWWDLLARWWKIIAFILVALYVITFVAIFYLAHYRSWALRVLTDPVWAKLAVWPFFALRHLRFAQQWVFAPYFNNIRKLKASDAPSYLQVAATGLDKEIRDASELIERLASKRLVWLHGGPGMGKSLIFRIWTHRYFSEQKNFVAAVKSFGFILIPILMRDYADVPEKADQRSEWFVEIVKRQLIAYDLRIEDIGLLKAMLSSGRFALALDGLNEADRDGALAEFVAAYPRVKIIATCQSLPTADFELWSLPKNISVLTQGLLQLWLGEREGDRIYRNLGEKKGLDYLMSGYDVRLIADLASKSTDMAINIASRIDLYRSVLKLATDDSGEPMDLSALKRTAWEMLLDGRRQFSVGERQTLGEMEVERLCADGIRILRRLGDRFEFRHDQMRSFLASLQLVEENPNIDAVIARLEKSEVWSCNRRDQEEIWRFVADLIAPSDLAVLWRAMLSDPARAWAQTALLFRAQNDGIVLAVSTSAGSRKKAQLT